MTHLLSNLVFLFFAIYHFCVGVPSLLSVKYLRKIAFKLYSLKLPEQLDPRYEYNLKPLGIYAITISLFSALEIFQTEKLHRTFVLGILSLLLTLRGLSRYFYRDLVELSFGVSWPRSRLNVFFNFILAFFIGVLAYATY